jgi:hypothetical protein
MAEKTEAAASSEGESIGLNRRELLNYAWAASIALFMAQAGVVTYLFALPRFGEGEFGGTFTFDVAVIPPKGAPPSNNPEGDSGSQKPRMVLWLCTKSAPTSDA